MSNSNWESGIAVIEENILNEKAGPTQNSLLSKREGARISMSIPIQYRILKNGFWIKATTFDISANGVRFAMSSAIPTGTCLELEIKLPERTRPVHVRGKVVWVVPSFSSGITMCGVALENLGRLPDHKKLMEFMADKFRGPIPTGL